MQYKSPLIVVADMQRSKQFYHDILGLETELDFGANVTLTGGISLQTRESWADFCGVSEQDIRFGGMDAELYFEEEDFNAFIARLGAVDGIEYVHHAVEHSWGQRAVRFYDPDRHIIEVGEKIEAVCRRFLEAGLSPEQVAIRMDVPLSFVTDSLA